MSLPYTAEMMESIKKVEAGRAARIGFEPRRMTADEKTALLQAFHPDYNLDSFEEIKVDKKPGARFKRIDPVDAVIDAHALMLITTGGDAAPDVSADLDDYLAMMGWA